MSEQNSLLQALHDEIKMATETMYSSIGFYYEAIGDGANPCSEQELYLRGGSFRCDFARFSNTYRSLAINISMHSI